MNTEERRLLRWRFGLTIAFCPLVLGGAFAVGALVMVCLTRYADRALVAGGIAGGGVALAALGAFFLMRTKRPWRAVAGVALCWLLTFGLGASMLTRQVTWTGSGLTVYGLMPIPVFDVVIEVDGRLRLRDKVGVGSSEIAELVHGEDVDVLVIGTGFKTRIGVDPVVRALAPDVRVLRTSEAFEVYEHLRCQGLRVILVAHTT